MIRKGKRAVLLEVVAPWIIDAWLDCLAAMSFDIPTLALDLYTQHITIAVAALVLLMLAWHIVGPIPRRAKLACLALLTVTMLAPFAILTAVHLDEISELPQFNGRTRVAATTEPAIKTQRLPPSMPLKQTPQAPSTTAIASPAPQILAAANPKLDNVPSVDAPPALPPAPISARPPESPITAATSTIKRAAAGLSQRLPGNSRTELMPVFYGTDRLPDPASPRTGYTANAAPHLTLGSAFIQVPRRHQKRQGDTPWVAAIPQAEIAKFEVAASPGLDLERQFAIAAIKPLNRDDFLEQTVMRLASSQRYKDHALVFIPGFNTSFDTSLYRAAQLAYDLQFDGAPFVYSWPSDGQTVNYKHDSEAVAKASAHFAEFLRIVVGQTGAKTVSFIAHGLGSRLTLEVLAAMKNEMPPGVAVRELILTAPDIEAAAFKASLAALSGLAHRTTLYVASSDRALNISRRYTGGVPRAGDLLSGGPLVLTGVETVDVGTTGTQILSLNHPDYVDEQRLIRDLASRLMDPTSSDHQSASVESISTPNGAYVRLR